jgi:hypothetical protein
MVQIPSEHEFGDYATWSGRAALATGGSPAGTIEEIFLDTETRRPEWVLLRLDDDGGHRLVPLAGARIEGETLHLDHAGDRIQSAPVVSTTGPIPQEQERELYAHYGLDYSHEGSGTGLPSDPTQDEAATGTVPVETDAGDAGGARVVAPAEPVDPVPAAAAGGPRLARVQAPDDTADAGTSGGTELDREQAREDLDDAPPAPVTPPADSTADFAFPASPTASGGSSGPDKRLIAGGVGATLLLALLVLIRRRRS